MPDKTQNQPIAFFFLDHAKDLRVFVLRENSLITMGMA